MYKKWGQGLKIGLGIDSRVAQMNQSNNFKHSFGVLKLNLFLIEGRTGAKEEK